MTKDRWIVCFPGSLDERRMPLDKPFYQIGRGADAGIRLSNSRVSTLHASLYLKEESVTLQDLDSTNGTRVNGKKVKTIELHDGDEIFFADVPCRFHEAKVEKQEVSGAKAMRTDPAFVHAEASLSEEGARLLSLLSTTGQLAREDILLLREEWERADRHVHRLDALYRMLELTLGVEDRELLLSELLSSVSAIMDVETCGLYWRETEEFFVREAGGLKRETEGGRMSATVLARVLETGEPVFLDAAKEQPDAVGFQSLLAMNIESLLCVPLFDSGRTVCGALYCLSSRIGALGALERDRPFLKAAGVVVRLSLMAEARERALKEDAQAMERRTQEERFLPIIRRLKERNENLSLYQDKQGPYGWDMADNADLMQFAKRASTSDLPVLITGETGTGKSLYARELHRLGRGDKPFVIVDCTTLQPTLIESELFGHEKGAFTGAIAKKPGKVTAAKEGTLFIDEVGDLPLDMQGKLLRLLQTGEFESLGSVETKKSTARFVFATNRDLFKEVKERRFREDLFFRLTVLTVSMPPLRYRPALVLPLANHFLRQYAARMKSNVKGFSEQAQSALLRHSWPGNVRELENTVARSLFNPSADPIPEEDLMIENPLSVQTEQGTLGEGNLFQVLEGEEGFDLKRARERVDRHYIKRALVLTKGNVSQSAKKLNLSRNSLMELIAKYGL